MGSIIELVPNKKYHLFWDAGKHPDGKRYRPSERFAGTKREATRRLQQREAESDAKQQRLTPEVMTLADWYPIFRKLATQAGAEDGTLRWYAYNWPRVEDSLGTLPLVAITRAHIEHFVTALATSTRLDDEQKPPDKRRLIAPTTRQAHFRFLHLLLEKALTCNKIPTNPAHGIDAPKGNASKAQAYNIAETAKILELLKTEPLSIRLLISLALYTGGRRGELIGLRWGDIDLLHTPDGPTCLIRIERSAIRPKGADQTTKIPKTPGSIRVVGAPAHIHEVLQSWRATFPTMPTPGDYIFRWPDTGAWWSLDNPTHQFTAFVTRHALRKLRFHDCRHTYASLLLSSGHTWEEVKSLLGHSLASTTLNSYSHLISEPAKTSGARIDNLLAPKSAPPGAKKRKIVRKRSRP